MEYKGFWIADMLKRQTIHSPKVRILHDLDHWNFSFQKLVKENFIGTNLSSAKSFAGLGEDMR